MQSLEKRLTSLEAAEAKCRPLEQLTDAELDKRIAALRARVAADDEETANEGTRHAKP